MLGEEAPPALVFVVFIEQREREMLLLAWVVFLGWDSRRCVKKPDPGLPSAHATAQVFPLSLFVARGWRRNEKRAKRKCETENRAGALPIVKYVVQYDWF